MQAIGVKRAKGTQGKSYLLTLMTVLKGQRASPSLPLWGIESERVLLSPLLVLFAFTFVCVPLIPYPPPPPYFTSFFTPSPAVPCGDALSPSVVPVPLRGKAITKGDRKPKVRSPFACPQRGRKAKLRSPQRGKG